MTGNRPARSSALVRMQRLLLGVLRRPGRAQSVGSVVVESPARLARAPRMAGSTAQQCVVAGTRMMTGGGGGRSRAEGPECKVLNPASDLDHSRYLLASFPRSQAMMSESIPIASWGTCLLEVRPFHRAVRAESPVARTARTRACPRQLAHKPLRLHMRMLSGLIVAHRGVGDTLTGRACNGSIRSARSRRHAARRTISPHRSSTPLAQRASRSARRVNLGR